ncbi:MAG: rod shape-determining protein MreC [Bacteriovoracia bacterium]
MYNNSTSISKSKVITNFLVIVISLYALSQKDFKEDRISFFEKLLIETFAPIQEGTDLMKGKAINFVEDYLLIINTNRENRRLKKDIEQLESRIFHLKELEKENQRLKALLKFGEEINRERILAQVVAKDASSNLYLLRVNKGTNDGVQEKSPVVTAKGLVGYVYRVTDNYSDILTILDPNNRVDVIVSRTRSHGILEGYRNFAARMKYVVRTAPVKEKDIIITAGLGNIYPKGIKVGIISQIEKESYGITQFVKVRPSVDFHRLEEVMILTGPINVPADGLLALPAKRSKRIRKNK